jgi:hypothetical protein
MSKISIKVSEHFFQTGDSPLFLVCLLVKGPNHCFPLAFLLL